MSGELYLTISDALGCDSVSTYTILDGSVNYTFTDSIEQVSCNGLCDGYIEIQNITGGSLPLTYT